MSAGKFPVTDCVPAVGHTTAAKGGSSRDDCNHGKGRSLRDAACPGGRARAHRSGTQSIHHPPAIWHRAQAAGALRQGSECCDFRSAGRLRTRAGHRDFGPSGAHLQPGPWEGLSPRPLRRSVLRLGEGKQPPTGPPAEGLLALACHLSERDAKGQMNLKSIILAVDKDSSGGAVAVAAGLARRLAARITLVHFGRRVTHAEDAVTDAVKSLERSGVTFDLRLEQPTSGATIAESLVNMADDLHTDLIVLGSRGRLAPLASLFGSVSREVARGAHVPVPVSYTH